MAKPSHLALVEQARSLDLAFEDDELVLSLRDGEVWASWRDGRAAAPLDEHDSVVAMMRNFIRQSEVADSLAKRVRSSSLAN